MKILSINFKTIFYDVNMKVLVVSFDGLQPSQINEDLMPNLYGYLNEGVIFTNHHAVIPLLRESILHRCFQEDTQALMALQQTMWL